MKRFYGNDKIRRMSGGPRHRWDDNIKNYIKEIDHKDAKWVQLANN
jgi:hypothetical protein